MWKIGCRIGLPLAKQNATPLCNKFLPHRKCRFCHILECFKLYAIIWAPTCFIPLTEKAEKTPRALFIADRNIYLKQIFNSLDRSVLLADEALWKMDSREPYHQNIFSIYFTAKPLWNEKRAALEWIRFQPQVDAQSECEFGNWKRINPLTNRKSFTQEYICCDNSVSESEISPILFWL